jgi:hypothetical protein
MTFLDFIEYLHNKDLPIVSFTVISLKLVNEIDFVNYRLQ